MLDGDQLKSIHADAIDTPVPRQPADLPFLFGEGTDLQFLENVTSDGVATHLRYARDRNEALQLLLILLDAELSQDVRQEAANVLEELLSTDEVAQHLLRVLYAQPLPDNADLAGALACCKMGSAKSAQDFFDALTNFQPIIREVRLAWDAIPDAAFGSAEVRAQYHTAVVRDGVFRDLVMTIAKSQDVDRFKARSLQRPLVEILPELQLILQLWISPLRNKLKAPDAQIKQQKPNARAQTAKKPEPSIDTKPSKIDNKWIASRQDEDRLLGNHYDKHAAKLLLDIRTKLFDGTEIHLLAQDTELVFKTALGVSRILLSNVARIKNVSTVVTLRKFLWANKFEIHCSDGCKIIGVPKSPAVIHFRDPDTPHARGKIKLWEIDWLEVQTIRHETEVLPLALPLK